MKLASVLTEGEYRLFQWIVFLGGSFYGGWLLYSDHKNSAVYAAKEEEFIAQEKKKQRPMTEEYWRELQEIKPRNLEELYKMKEEKARQRAEKFQKWKEKLLGLFGLNRNSRSSEEDSC
ncbi:hypothetical protein Gasu2_29260 [Galdieria sulphuraria]|uniref:Transmembrane protein n=1 Tax=Galdieria sulphuraria TaxID=130081 RepID=M2XJW4_GALSU|nr:hypothetical protein Gasu_23140 isoform 2 [Galdieria sulphuraria]XP_005706928.1 hypothetical protein Gasu_23140 isoform 1 [Galdieria sulphuraria]EME30407.1 hypothetical protein Gasu_23140 isoform 2 [Galdieria sulphuraria]EME30408.1 hypothetical protein Gasu_23140 isoform 1 [Galdieria sulphuraria]GJD08634.1 hypothetical protein Gasu2_29260 [Galdieria sulphuraria]|eukprot:XP_005706927.1 hypothetical protein isoform 2 [Galdieria sulphuraria]